MTVERFFNLNSESFFVRTKNIPKSIHVNILLPSLIFLVTLDSKAENQGPVVRRPISANPGLNFNLRFFIPLLKSLFGKIFSVLFKASSSHTLNKKNSTEFSCKAFRSEIGFHTNPGLS